MTIVKRSRLSPEQVDERPAVLELRKTLGAGLVRRPHIDTVLTDAYSVLSSQLAKLREKVDLGYELDRDDVRNFAALTEALARLAKEEREQRAADKLDTLSDEELLAMAQEAEKALKGG